MSTRTHPLPLRAALAACLIIACTETSPSDVPGEPAPLGPASSAPLLAAGTPFLVKDLASTTRQPYYLSKPGSFTAVGNTVFFVVDNGVFGSELWKVEGASPGISLVGDLLPGAESSAPSHLTAMNGKLYFAATTAVGTRAPSALWSSDGTAQGTRPLVALGAQPSFITQKDGFLYFEAPSLGSSAGVELWKSDGTPQGTVRLKALTSTVRSVSTDAAWVGNTLFFTVHDIAQGHTLWKTDGTTAGTVLVEDVLPSTSPYERLFRFTVVNGVLLFQTPGAGDWRYQLWRSDGTAEGTFPLLSLQTYSGGSAVVQPVIAGSAAYFPQWDSEAGLELWRTDGTSAGTVRVTDIFAGTSGSSPMHLAALGEEVFFVAKIDNFNTWELWKTNGTTAGTARVTLPTGWHPSGEYGPPMAASPSAVFFVAYSSPSGTQLWKTDGTATGTVQVTTGSYPGLDSPTPQGWLGGALYFTTFDDRLWRSDGTATGTIALGGLHSLQESSSPRNGVNLGGSLLFVSGSAGNSGLTSSSGTAQETFFLYGSNPIGLQPADGQLFFWEHSNVSTNTERFQLKRTDGSSLGTVALKSFSEERSSSDRARPPSSTLLGGALFFATDPTGSELPAVWKSDGTVQGTMAAVTLRQDDFFVLTPRLLTTVGNRLFFAGGFGFGSDALWTSDGTQAGTRRVKDFTASAGPWSLRYLTGVGGTAFLWADTQAEGSSLWKSDGTTAGTVLLARLSANDRVLPGPTTTAVLNGELYFATAPLMEPPQLWKTNGQQVVRVATFGSLNGGPAPSHFTAFNGALLFWAHDVEHGYELWRTDGTTAGTVRVKDINPGPASAVGTPGALVALGPGGPLLFGASDGASGMELWQTDGTAAGTVPLADIAPGPASSSPASLAVAGPHLYFQAWNESSGTELWALSRPVTDTEPPQLTCPSPQVAEATSPYGASSVTYPPATASDTSGVRPVVRYSSPSGSYFYMGSNPVTVTALDDTGNSATCTFTLTVRDTLPPTVTCPGPKSLEANTAGGAVNWNTPAATARDIASTPQVSYLPAAGSVLPVGTTQVRATATDGVGLMATCSFPVTVKDTTAPSLEECPAEIQVEATRPEGAAVSFTLPRAFDVVAPPEVSAAPAADSLFALGRTEVTITARDGVGNQTRCTFPITVVDTTAPSITCPPAQQVVAAANAQGAAVVWPAATAQDSVSEARVSYSQEPGSQFALGTHAVTVTATDASGNSQQCSFTVRVTQAEQPGPGPAPEPEPAPGPEQPPESGCGCGQSSGQGAALLGLGVLAMLSLPRRRRATLAG